MVRDRFSALKIRPVTLTELLHLMAALNGGLRRRSVGAAAVNVVGDLLPVGGAEVASPESVPLVSVGVDEGGGLVGCPARRRKAAGGGWWWCGDGAGHEEGEGGGDGWVVGGGGWRERERWVFGGLG